MTTIESFHTGSVPTPPPLPVQSTAAPVSTFPVVTSIILIAIGVIFAAEVVLGVEPWSGAFQPGVTTLMAFGGLQYPLVVDQGQWYRLLSAPLLHLDISHVLINGVVLWYSGRVLESMIGRSWFAAVFIVGGIAGSLMSLAVNAHNVRLALPAPSWRCSPRVTFWPFITSPARDARPYRPGRWGFWPLR